MKCDECGAELHTHWWQDSPRRDVQWEWNPEHGGPYQGTCRVHVCTQGTQPEPS